jgi:hypothetical protein
LNNGNFLIVGNKTTDGNGYTDGWLIKIDTNGDTIWSKTFGDGEFDEFGKIQPISGGNFLIAGKTVPDSNEHNDGWLIKINTDGDTIWTKKYGSDNNINHIIEWIQPVSEGNFLILGNRMRISTGVGYDGWCAKIKPNGDTIWTKSFGGAMENYFNTMQPTSDGNVLIAGWIEAHSWLVKINPDGNTFWTKTCGDIGRSRYSAVQPSSDGNFLIVGYTDSSTEGNFNPFILCLIADQYAYKDSLFTFKIPTYDVDSLNCGYSPINVPSGMTVSTGGTVSWTPKTDSVYMDHAEFLVINDVGRKDTLSFNIFVNSDYHAPVLKKPARINTTSSKPFEIIATSLSGKVKFSLPSSTSSLSIYDITGRMVDRIVPVISGSVVYAVWPNDPSRCSQFHVGKYFAKATGGKNSAVEPFLLVR